VGLGQYEAEQARVIAAVQKLTERGEPTTQGALREVTQLQNNTLSTHSGDSSRTASSHAPERENEECLPVLDLRRIAYGRVALPRKLYQSFLT
jgi:hypothetical protein